MKKEDDDEIPLIQVPQTYGSIDEFDRWLHDVYIPVTQSNFTECWGIFSANGRFERQFETSFYMILTPELESDLQGKILSHSHPTDSTFSLSDLKTWAGLKIKEIRAITATQRFIIRPLNEKWPQENDIEKEMDRLSKQLEIDMFDIEVLSGPTPSQLRDKCYQIMADSGWFFYTQEDFSPLLKPFAKGVD